MELTYLEKMLLGSVTSLKRQLAHRDELIFKLNSELDKLRKAKPFFSDVGARAIAVREAPLELKLRPMIESHVEYDDSPVRKPTHVVVKVIDDDVQPIFKFVYYSNIDGKVLTVSNLKIAISRLLDCMSREIEMWFLHDMEVTEGKK